MVILSQQSWSPSNESDSPKVTTCRWLRLLATYWFDAWKSDRVCSTARHLPYSVQQEKHNVSLVQCTQPDGELKVVCVNWADISALYGQFLFLDERNRIKSSVFSAFPYHRLEAVVFIVPDTGVYPRKWHHSERPELDADTLRLKDMWNATIANRKAPP